MFLKSAAILFICGFLCSTAICQEPKVEALPAPPPAKLVFYRVTGYPGHLLHASIKIDGGKAVHKIADYHSWTTEVPAGPHLIYIYGDDERYGRTYTLEGGKTYYFRVVDIPPSMTSGMHFRVLKVTDDIADAEMTGLEAD